MCSVEKTDNFFKRGKCVRWEKEKQHAKYDIDDRHEKLDQYFGKVDLKRLFRGRMMLPLG